MHEFEFEVQDVVTGENGTARVQIQANGASAYSWSCSARVGEREVAVSRRSTEIPKYINGDLEYRAAYLAGPALREEAFEFKHEPPLDG